MKIRIIQHRELAGGKIVQPGDMLESPKDGSDELLQAYVDNCIAVVAGPTEPKVKETATNGI